MEVGAYAIYNTILYVFCGGELWQASRGSLIQHVVDGVARGINEVTLRQIRSPHKSLYFRIR